MEEDVSIARVFLHYSDSSSSHPICLSEAELSIQEITQKNYGKLEACGYAYRDQLVRFFMKIQRNADLYSLSLVREHSNYQLVQGCVRNLPRVIDHGEDGPWTFLVVEELGTDLGKLVRRRGLPEFYFAFHLVAGMLFRLRDIHRAGFIHADVKPGNFIFGRRNALVSIIDLETLRQCPAPSCTLYYGTPMWASQYSLRGEALSCRDDLISFAHCVVYFVRGSLPSTEEDCRDVKNLARIKAEILVNKLCETLPLQS